MKIILLSDVMPTPENVRGASALPYHLMICRDSKVELVIYSFNNNRVQLDQIEKIKYQLNCSIHLLKQPKWIKWILWLRLLVIRIFLPFPIFNYIKIDDKVVNEIEASSPDGIWIYGQENSRIEKQFEKYRICHLLPDCQSLYYYRMIGQRFVFFNAISFLKNVVMYRKYLRMEKAYTCSKRVTYLLVGEKDRDALTNVNPKLEAKFLRHPHYNVNDNANVHFHKPKIKVVIAGQYNLYMKQEADLLVEQICNVNVNDNENCLREHYSITFLGKGWERHVEALRNVGYEVSHITFAPDYIEEICKHDIQITPIAIGTGTKGKVLDALANGLLVIGTPYALENIAVKHGESCIEYRQPQEVIEVLRNIPNNIQEYEMMAEIGRERVLRCHDRKLISEQLFSLFKEA